MPPVTRLYDMTRGWGSHGLPCCPHVLTGYRVSGSPDVDTNGLSTSRANVDMAFHDCPHCSINTCIQGSPDVIVNGHGVHRRGDAVTEHCGFGSTVTGSPDVFANGEG